MHHLTSLSLQNATMVSDGGCAAIARITSLRNLNLKNCPALTDASLALLTPLDRLCHLKLQVSLCLQLVRDRDLQHRACVACACRGGCLRALLTCIVCPQRRL